MEWRKTILVTVAALALAGAVRADMIPLSCPDVGPHPSAATCDPRVSPPVTASVPLDVSGLADLDSLDIALLAGGDGDVEQSAAADVLISADRQNSLTLCLYALLSMGLCKSAPWVKKLSLGAIPGWYHDGGPLQVGHSLAISPDCLISAPVYCFVQPDCGDEPPLPQYRRGAIVSLWRKSQFTPTVLASRGPPFCS